MSGKLVSLLVLLAVVASVIADPCGDVTWRYSPVSNKCYKLFNIKTGWTISEFKCLFMGGHHISIHDAQDNQFVSGMFNT